MDGLENKTYPMVLPSQGQRICPGCKVSLSTTTHGQSLFMGCSKCDSYINFSGDKPKTKKFDFEFKPKPVFAIGTKGVLRNILYEIVGYIQWCEENTYYYWSEYILFNPIHGYVHLSEYNGHWMLLNITDNYPRGIDEDLTFPYNGLEYKMFNKYFVEVIYAEGEFYWDIMGRRTFVREYICPPNILIKELSETKCVWLTGEHISANELSRAFTSKVAMPAKSGAGMVEPFLNGLNMDSLRSVTIFSVLLLFGICILTVFTSSQKEIFVQTFPLEDSTGLRPVVTPSFTLEGGLLGSTDLDFHLYSGVDNEWMEAGITLINDATDEEYNLECGVEYYHGIDSDGTWTEGSQNDNKFISNVPEGIYHMVISPAAQRTEWGRSFKLTVLNNVPIPSNFIITLGLLLVIPGILWYLHSNFEKTRWSNSDYSPYDED